MSLDLTTSYPRSVHEKLFGLVQIARTLDKGQALAHGNIGEYHYNCPMDQGVFAFLGIDHEALLDVIKKSQSDAEVEAYVKPFIDKKTPAEIEAWNTEWLGHKPGPESLEYFTQLRDAAQPGREDITTWADVLDLDEKRTVPRRAPISA